MAYDKRRFRKLDDLPGLWDIPLEDDFSNDNVSDVINSFRRKQSTPQKTIRESELDRHMLESTPRRKELEFISFGSGSSGNCAYIGIRGMGGVLIDAGVDHRTVISELERNYIPLDKVNGIILTHDHSDHVRYAYSLLRKLPSMKIYCTPRTLTGILRRHNISSRIKDFHKQIFKEFEFEAGPLSITPFEVSHDGSDNVGFSIKAGNQTFVVATDTGKITDRADFYIRKASFLMIETDYDEKMLEQSSYPNYLKERIRRDSGHMSNNDTARYLGEIWTDRLTDIFLCHLSDNNNTPQLALSTVSKQLSARGLKVGDGSGSSEARSCAVQLSALPRDTSSPHHILRIS